MSEIQLIIYADGISYVEVAQQISKESHDCRLFGGLVVTYVYMTRMDFISSLFGR